MGNGLAAALGVVALRLYTELAPPDVYGMASLILGSLSGALFASTSMGSGTLTVCVCPT